MEDLLKVHACASTPHPITLHLPRCRRERGTRTGRPVNFHSGTTESVPRSGSTVSYGNGTFTGQQSHTMVQAYSLQRALRVEQVTESPALKYNLAPLYFGYYRFWPKIPRTMADASGTRALRCLVIFGCVFTAMCGLALMAVAIWVVVDPFNLKSRGGMLVYLVLMLIVYIFECASCITAATHRDYLVGNSNLVKKQMLQYYAANSTAGVKITKTWNQVMENVQCCGADSPLDWIQYTSTYNQNFGPVNQWPFSCCRRNANFEVMNLAACKIGHSSSIYTQGCFQYIQSKLSLYTWAIGWYGFAVLMFVFIHMLVAMVYYIKL
ncbi:hypothetical protein ANANG_G00002210 [Anguilla anguilla]|uniref:Tetraspanin n=1 Tax=Anguilla anguilla TaxID=7936 RepID=A0A9D3S555_ANGAN|nr:hypothetical protein ANANG_G00002210 [Anguilla anguilla]